MELRKVVLTICNALTICGVCIVLYLEKYTTIYCMNQVRLDNFFLTLLWIVLICDILFFTVAILKRNKNINSLVWLSVLCIIICLASLYLINTKFPHITIHTPKIISYAENHLIVNENDIRIKIYCTESELALIKSLPSPSKITFLSYKATDGTLDIGILQQIKVMN